MNLKKDGAYYIGEYVTGYYPDEIFFSFLSCASNAAYQYINVYDGNGKFMGYLELIGGDYE